MLKDVRYASHVSLLLLFLALDAALCQNAPNRGTAPALTYTLSPEWPVQARSAAGTPAGPWNFIQVAAVAINASGNVLVLHRGAHPIMEFDNSGKLVRTWGDGMISEGKVVAISPRDRPLGGSGYSAVYGPAGCFSCGAHSIRVDPEGNIWLVDATGHVVYKMNPQGKVVMQLGRRGVSGIGTTTFNLPTDVAFAPNGDIYVSDGYGNPRVVKYSRDGKYLLQWGRRGTGPGEFELPHNLAVDAQGRVYVTDRDNRRIQIFDPSGKFLKEWTNVGGVSSLFMTKDQRLWASGTLRDLEGNVLAVLPEAAGAHGAAVNDGGDVYIAQLSGIVQKFVKP
jgi:DNA-binding beta-propeller fold protein YncE